ncbi:MAG TPA: nuclear transport factor 2 family protein [Candidatus Binataceae bacterium]|nr:nuclear transport factor 2 family protein [Candidatus Binataceae bacterium]
MAVSEQARLATVEEHVRGENARDLDVIMGTFSDSDSAAVLYNGIPTIGHRKIRRSYEVRLNALPDFRFEVKQRHFSADSLIAEHLLCFTDKQGQPVEVPMCIIYCFNEAGKLSEERVYIDESKLVP